MTRILLLMGLLFLITLPRFLLAQSVFDYPVSYENLPNTLKELSTNLQDQEIYRAKFIQTRKISILEYPLVTKGELVFSSEYGVHWETKKPFRSSVLISPKGFFERKNGQLILQYPKNVSSDLKRYLNTFLLMFSGDFQKLNQSFKLSYLYTKPYWKLGLSPKKILAKILKNIEISGAFPSTLNEILIRETNGDLTRIELHATESSISRLTPKELKLFE